jgi:hypothetical protein
MNFLNIFEQLFIYINLLRMKKKLKVDNFFMENLMNLT